MLARRFPDRPGFFPDTSRSSRTVGPWSAAAVILALAACPSAVLAASQPLRVVTSIPPLAMLVSELGGDHVTCHSILPPGADPHTFEPRPSDAVAVAEADLLVVLGSSIDDWLGESVTAPEATSVVRLDAKEEASHDVEDDHAHHAHDGGEDDPHVWLDPVWVRDRALPAIHRGLATADPSAAASLGFSARAMAERLTDLDEDIRDLLVDAPTRSFLAWHPAWAHFARRYRLHDAGSVKESGGREPSLYAMVAAIRAARGAGVRAVLVEPQVDPRQAAVLAGELDVPLVTVDPLGDAWSRDRSTYTRLMLFNAQAFAESLGVEPKEEDEAKGPPQCGAP